MIYYNQTAKTIWAYIADEDVQSGRCAVRGTVENIYYSSSDVMTPTSITLDDGQEYKLSSSEMPVCLLCLWFHSCGRPGNADL